MARTPPTRAGERIRKTLLVLALAVAIGYPALYVFLLSDGIRRPDLLLDAALAAVAVAFLWRAGPHAHGGPHACPTCMGRLRRTRSPAGVRYWTCSQCGYERPRAHSRRRQGPTAAPDALRHGDFMRSAP